MAIYYRIEEYSTVETCCDERMAICPDCGYEVCVFCMDGCDMCDLSMW